MCNLLSNPLFWYFTIPIGLFVWIGFLLTKHSKAIDRLNSGLSNANIQLEREVVGVGFYIRIIAYILLAACVGVAIHYMAIELPRVLNNQYTNSHIDNLGVDYLGLIVAIFAIIVTLLVGWQIYATIRARQELTETRDEIERRLNERFSKYDDCYAKRKEEIQGLIKEKNDLAQELKELKNAHGKYSRQSFAVYVYSMVCKSIEFI